MFKNWIALSFVRSAEDIIDLRDANRKSRESLQKIVAKIEKPEALENI